MGNLNFQRTVVTVDGLAASGKSSLSSALARKVGYLHFSSGAIYRAVGLLIVKARVDAESASQVMALINGSTIELVQEADGRCEVLLNGLKLGKEIYTAEVSDATSKSSALPEVRERLLPLQRGAYPDMNLVAEGRDMGTIVFWDSPLKFFITASPEVRVQRRLKQQEARQGRENHLKSLKDKVEMEIMERDKRDQERLISPTIAASDAVIIDNTSQKLTEVVENMYSFILERGLPH